MIDRKAAGGGKTTVRLRKATTDDPKDKTLRSLWAAGKPAKVIAEELGVTEGWVRQRRMLLGLQPRKSYSPGRVLRQRVTFFVTNDLHRAIGKAANAEDLPVSEWVRQLLQRRFKVQ